MSLAVNAMGIFGGSFNPVHLGHVKLAEEIQTRCHFHPLWIIPNKSPPHKPPYEVSGEARMEMAKLAFESIPDTQISSFELDSEGPSYAIRTIEAFTRKYPGTPLFFILGADAFHEIHQWYAFPDVLEACSYLVATRAGWESDDALDESSKLGKRLRQMIERGLLTEKPAYEPFTRVFTSRTGTQVCVLEARAPEISSTAIRLRLQMGESVENLVPNNVAHYLKNSRLYVTKTLGD